MQLDDVVVTELARADRVLGEVGRAMQAILGVQDPGQVHQL